MRTDSVRAAHRCKASEWRERTSTKVTTHDVARRAVQNIIITDLPNDLGHHLGSKRLGGESVMRHFLPLALAPDTLASGMKLRATPSALVACAGAAHGLAPPETRAIIRAVDVATVTVPADPHLALAALAVEQPVVVLEHRDPRRRGLDIRRVSRHKEAAVQLTSSAVTQKARGLAQGPGPSLFSAVRGA